MPRVGAGAGDGLSTGAASALLGAQDAEYLREGTAPRRKAGQDPGAEDLLGRACCCRAAGLCALPLSLAVPLPGDGPPTGARSAGVVALLRLSTTPVAEAAHHQRDRTLFRRSPAPDPTHGGVHQRGKRGSDYLCDCQSLQRGLEKPHPPTIYTSSLASPVKYSYSLAVSRCATPNDPRSNKKEQSVSKGVSKGVSGAPGETRTPDPLLRRQTLYPTELRAPDS